jgi:DNA-directed RNA polymerases I, II, and III subunit RPABC1
MEEEDEFDRSVAVFFNFTGEEITPEYIKRVMASGSENKVFHYFLVAPSQTKKNTAGGIDRKAQTFINDITKKTPDSNAPPFKFEIFRQDELLFNVLHHDLVPKHILMNEAQKIDLLRK